MFGYSKRLDGLNLRLLEVKENELGIIKVQRNNDILKNSQPRSIFNPDSSELMVYPSRSYQVRRAIFVPNSYEFFLAPWVADGSCTYANDHVRSDWKTWFSAGHNAKKNGIDIINHINPDRFDGLKLHFNRKLKFLIKNHIDADNYWHWTFEFLPRLYSLKDYLNSELKNIDFIVIGENLNSFQIQWIKMIFGEDIQITYYKSPILLNNVFYNVPTFPSHHSREYVTCLRETVKSFSITNRESRFKKNHKSKIYIRRGKAKNGRNIKNESEIIDFLKTKGFYPISMDKLSIVDQYDLFSNARCIVGPHGSAFVNMIFCKANSKILELFGPGYISGHDFSLSLSSEVDWHYIMGTSEENQSFTSDYCIDLRVFEKAYNSIFGD